MGHLGLHPLYLQMSYHGSLCSESPGIAPVHAHYSFSTPARRTWVWRNLEPLLPMLTLASAVLSVYSLYIAPQDVTVHALCAPQLLCQDTSGRELEH